MSAPPPPPPQVSSEEGRSFTLSPEANAATGAAFGVLGVLVAFSLVFLFIFHLGAGYLSYQKYGNILWAVVDFLFAYFYYPYYAFFLASDPSPQPVGMMGGAMRLLKAVRRRK